MYPHPYTKQIFKKCSKSLKNYVNLSSNFEKMIHEDSFYMSLCNILDLFLTEHSCVLLFFHIPVNKILQSSPLHLVLNSRKKNWENSVSSYKSTED